MVWKVQEDLRVRLQAAVRVLAVVVLGFTVLLISAAGRASASAVPIRTGLSQAGFTLWQAGIVPASHVRLPAPH